MRLLDKTVGNDLFWVEAVAWQILRAGDPLPCGFQALGVELGGSFGFADLVLHQWD